MPRRFNSASMESNTNSAENLFRQALGGACRQQMLSWALRAATSIARLLPHQGRFADAVAYLQPVYNRFAEGFGTADLIVAKRLLHEAGGFDNMH